MLNVERGDDSNAGLQEVLHVLPATFVFGARSICVGKLVDQRDGGVAGDDRFDVHLLPKRFTVIKRTSGNRLETDRGLDRQRAAVGFDIADYNIGATNEAALAFV